MYAAETEISAGLMDHFARVQTLHLYKINRGGGGASGNTSFLSFHATETGYERRPD